MKLKIRVVLGLFHYAFGAALFCMPWIIESGSTGLLVCAAAGAFMLAASWFSNFELGLFRILRYKDLLYLLLFASLVVLAAPLGTYIGGTLQWFVSIPALLSVAGTAVSLKSHHTNRHRVRLSHL